MKVGITGHQNLGEAVEWVSNALAAAIKEYQVTLGLTSLAGGADQLYAQALRAAGIPYIAIIPSKGYEQSFTDKRTQDNYWLLLSHAQQQVTLNFDAPGEPAYLAAGQDVVQRAELMFAVWNGQPAAGVGGTGDIVVYALQHKKKVVHFNPILREITVKTSS